MREKQIRFIDSHYKTLFTIKDGESIVIKLSDGEERTAICEFLDEYHTNINHSCYHICQFAELMERNGSTYRPAQEGNK